MKYFRLTLLITLILFAITTIGQSTKSNKTKRPSNFGIFGGIGISNFNISNSNWAQPPINYSDSLNSINSTSNISVNIGLTYQLRINQNLSLRPAICLSLGQTGKLNYNRKIITETVNVQGVAECLKVPLLYRISNKKNSPYITLGPALLYNIGQAEETTSKIELNKFDFLGEVGLGIEVPTKHFKFSPELSFSKGFINAKANNNNLYSKTITNLYRQSISLSFYFMDSKQ